MSGPVWIASYVLLWLAVCVLAFAVVVLLRQIGVLHARIRPMGVHPAGEGLAPGTPAPQAGVDYTGAALTLVAFTSPTCQVCARLLPSLRTLARDYRDVALQVVSTDTDTSGIFAAFGVRSTPYVVAVGPDGRVRAGGVVNTLEQAEELIAAVLAAPAPHQDLR